MTKLLGLPPAIFANGSVLDNNLLTGMHNSKRRLHVLGIVSNAMLE